MPESSPRLLITRLVQSKVPDERSPAEYRQIVKDCYNGAGGWATLIWGFFTGHESLAENVIGPLGFDISSSRRILDVGCGNGRYLRFLYKQADPNAELVGCDLSHAMLSRARNRLKSDRPHLLTADLTRLPYADGSFDAIVCGWVLEHLVEPRAGVQELARVVAPEGKILLITTEDTVVGAVCSRLYHTRTLPRAMLKQLCAECGLCWHREYSWSKLHRALGLGGIVVELRKAVE